jgi:16S rRNA (cytosine967-C5)-methyltransferase
MGAYFHSYQHNASSILEQYGYDLPFAIFLKKYFKQHKKFGSRDRKIIADLCFGYLRIGQSALTYSIHDQLIIGYYLTHQFDMGYLELFNPALIDSLGSPPTQKIEKIKSIYPEFVSQNIFGFDQLLSGSIDKEVFSLHHIRRPSFFIRIRPGKSEKILSVLTDHQVEYTILSIDSLRIEHNFNIESVLSIDSDCVVQDHASQRTFELLKEVQFPKHISIWDTCAGSGGKSIMAHDLFPDSALYVSDIREEILQELMHRFNRAGIRPKQVFCTDLQHSLSSQVAISNLPKTGIDLIIADVPCTGSGTWGRSPEWLR